MEKYLSKDKHMGEVDTQTLPEEPEKVSQDEIERRQRVKNMPPPRGMLQPAGLRSCGERCYENVRLGLLQLWGRRRNYDARKSQRIS